MEERIVLHPHTILVVTAVGSAGELQPSCLQLIRTVK